MTARPSVGSVTRDRIFSSVVFPAPLLPMRPSRSPTLTSKEISLTAQITSSGVWPFSSKLESLRSRLKFLIGLVAKSTRAAPKVSCISSFWPIR